MRKLYVITNFDKVPLMYAWVHLMGEGFMGGYTPSFTIFFLISDVVL